MSFSRVIMFDKRGQGLSDRPPQPPTIEQSATDARAVLDAVGSERAAVYGVSEGGPTSALLAATHPDRVSALVLYGTWARMIGGADYPEGIPLEQFERFMARGADATGAAPSASSCGRPASSTTSACSAGGRSCFGQGRLRRGAEALIRLYTQIDMRHVLPTITAPTLVLHRPEI